MTVSINTLHQKQERPKAYVALYYSIDAKRWRQSYESGSDAGGIVSDETPYGFHHAENYGFDLVFAEDAPRKSSGKFPALVTRAFGFDLMHAWTNRKRIAACDIIWTMTEGEGFAIALLSILRLVPQKPIICNVVWMLNEWGRGLPYKVKLYQVLARRIAILSVHSKPCLALARTVFPSTRSELMYFGVNSDLLVPRSPLLPRQGEPLHVISMGGDKTRDWTTVLTAFGNDNRFRLTVVCRRLTEKDVAGYSNVTLLRIKNNRDFVSCFQDADLAVVSMRENIFSGITSALDAASVGVPIISSRTGGVPTYFDEDEAYYVPVGDPVAMREAAASSTPAGRLATAARARQRFDRCQYSHKRLARNYCELSTSLLNR